MAKIKKCVTPDTMAKLTEAFKDDPEVLADIGYLNTCTKRKTSAYQEFVSQCLKGGADTIGGCAKKWQAMKVSK